MKYLSWNVKHQGLEGRLDEIVGAVAEVSPDIVLLQEVAIPLIFRLTQRLKEAGLEHAVDSIDGAPPRPAEVRKKKQRKGYAVVTASRWPIKRAKDKWRSTAPYPEVMLRAFVEPHDGPAIDVFNVHIPNGAGNGWRKIATLDVLYRALMRAKDKPRVLAGDFNEPREFRSSGQIVPFMVRYREGGGLTISERIKKDRFGTERTRSEWSTSVLRILAGHVHHGLRDVYRTVHGLQQAPVTHKTTGGNPRCFDHGFVSRHFEVKACGYRHDWRKSRLSDHSALWFELEPRSKLRALSAWSEGTEADLEDAGH